MPDLDLSKAIEAGARAVASSALTPAWWKAVDKPLSCATDVATDALTAALPHILEALAEDAQNEADRKRICVSGQMQPHYMDSYARWLRAKAVEARQ